MKVTSAEVETARATSLAIHSAYCDMVNWLRHTYNMCHNAGKQSAGPVPCSTFAFNNRTELAKAIREKVIALRAFDNQTTQTAFQLFADLHGVRPPLVNGELCSSYHARALYELNQLQFQFDDILRRLATDVVIMEAPLLALVGRLEAVGRFVEEGMRAEFDSLRLLEPAQSDRTDDLCVDESARRITLGTKSAYFGGDIAWSAFLRLYKSRSSPIVLTDLAGRPGKDVAGDVRRMLRVHGFPELAGRVKCVRRSGYLFE